MADAFEFFEEDLMDGLDDNGLIDEDQMNGHDEHLAQLAAQQQQAGIAQVNAVPQLLKVNITSPMFALDNENGTFRSKVFATDETRGQFPLEVELKKFNGEVQPLMVAVTGGTGAGKLELCQKLKSIASNPLQVAIIKQASFYRALTPAEAILAEEGKFNFDEPTALDFNLLRSVMMDLIHKRLTEIPIYDFQENKPSTDAIYSIEPSDIVLFEGSLALHFKEIRDTFHLKIFLDDDSDIRLSHRIDRDIFQHGRNVFDVIKQYEDYVKPGYLAYCRPTLTYTDLQLPRGRNSPESVQLISEYLNTIMSLKEEAYVNGMAGHHPVGI